MLPLFIRLEVLVSCRQWPGKPTSTVGSKTMAYSYFSV